jgi:hypothetical protein
MNTTTITLHTQFQTAIPAQPDEEGIDEES